MRLKKSKNKAPLSNPIHLRPTNTSRHHASIFFLSFQQQPITLSPPPPNHFITHPHLNAPIPQATLTTATLSTPNLHFSRELNPFPFLQPLNIPSPLYYLMLFFYLSCFFLFRMLSFNESIVSIAILQRRGCNITCFSFSIILTEPRSNPMFLLISLGLFQSNFVMGLP